MRLISTLLAVTAAILLTFESVASAGIFQPVDSTLSFHFGNMPPIVVSGTYRHGGWAKVYTDAVGAHSLVDSTSIWDAAGLEVGTTLLTGVGLLSRLTLTVANGPGSFTANFSTSNRVGGNLLTPTGTPNSATLCPGGCLGGAESLDGQVILNLIGLPTTASLGIVGVGGTATLPIGYTAITATANPFVTGAVRITGITTNVISLPDRSGVVGVALTLAPASTEEVRTFTTGGAFVSTKPSGPVLVAQTVTISGSDSLTSASATGAITLVSAMRIRTGPLGAGTIPGYVAKKFVFVPEPGTALSLGLGVVALAALGSRRMRKERSTRPWG